MAKQFFRKILCLTLGLSILAPQVVCATKSSPAVLVRNKNHFEPEQGAGDKFQSLDRGEFTERQADVLATVWQTTEFTYDILNKLKAVTDPLGRVTTYDYDPNGNLAKITDANNNPTTYTYGLFDRMDITRYADLSESNFDYDKNANLIRHTTPSGKPIEYSYDALNRLTTKTYPLTPALNTTYAYDLGVRMTAADNAASSIDFVYDALNRVTNATNTLNLTHITHQTSYNINTTR